MCGSAICKAWKIMPVPNQECTMKEYGAGWWRGRVCAPA
jgi:hypothetical protein